jgi:NAD(P)-dependent dehydrogenase (short-subunit alcohol dehydrogenase family)
MSKGMPDEVTANFIKQIPLGRLGDVSEIVNAALFLASPWPPTLPATFST